MKTLPTYEECEEAAQHGHPLTALQRFILEQEPAGSEQEKVFREGLAAAITEAVDTASVAEVVVRELSAFKVDHDVGRVIADTARELACEPDNEAILEAIAAMRARAEAVGRSLGTMTEWNGELQEKLAAVEAERDEACRQWKNYEAVAVERHAERDAARAAGEFLLARLNEWMGDNLTDDSARDWFGHVEPATARLRAALTGAGSGEGG